MTSGDSQPEERRLFLTSVISESGLGNFSCYLPGSACVPQHTQSYKLTHKHNTHVRVGESNVSGKFVVFIISQFLTLQNV